MKPLETKGVASEFPGLLESIVDVYKPSAPTFHVPLPGVGTMEFKVFDGRDDLEALKKAAQRFAKEAHGKRFPAPSEHLTALYAQKPDTLAYAWTLGQLNVGSKIFRATVEVVDGEERIKRIEEDGGKLDENGFLKIAREAPVAFEYLFGEVQSEQTNVKNAAEAEELKLAKKK